MLFHMIAAPADNTKELTFQKLKSRISSSGDHAEVYPAVIPDFKVGTLDSLMSLSDDLDKMDMSIESIILKLVDNIKNLLDGNVEQLKNTLLVNDRSVESYLKTFQWNSIKYRSDKSLKELSDGIVQEVTSFESMIKSKLNAYNTTRSSLVGIERKQTGNLATKSLTDVVKKENFITDSEYLVTQLVAVPKIAIADFQSSYERMSTMVVPRSAVKIAEDEEYALFSVVVFKRVVDEFANKVREQKCIPRDFTFDENASKNQKKELSELGASAKEQLTTLLRLCKTNFGEIFAAWIHMKAIRVFVEAILRYGLPPNFQAMIVKPKNKQEKRVRDLLNQHFASLGGALGKAGGKEDEPVETLQGVIYEKDYHPYVNFDIKLDWIV